MKRLTLTAVIVALGLANLAASGRDRISEGQWFHSFLNTANAHMITDGLGIVVAIVDTGVDAKHPDLANTILPGKDLTETAGDGRLDIDGHGTSMAGLVAAHGRVGGVAPRASILPVRFRTTGPGNASKLSEAIRWARQNSAKVISISSSSDSDDLLLRQEIQAALNADVVVVASVGNAPGDTKVGYPAAIPGVVAVAGVDKNGNHSAVSVTGPEVVIAAPSDGISSTDKGGGYREGTGTSDATAIVAGAAALVRSKYPNLKATEVVRRLTATAIDKGQPGRDNEYGYGVLNLVGALTADLPAPTSAAATSNNPTPTSPPSTKDRFPWWLIALPAGIGAIVIGVILTRRKALPQR